MSTSLRSHSTSRKIIRTASPQETISLGRKVGKLIGPGDLICLNGHLGSGKTTFIQGVAKGIGYTGRVWSPTFVIINVYSGRIKLYHVDLYRMSPGEVPGTGLTDYIGGDSAVAVEWADKASDFWPQECLAVNIVSDKADQRKFIFSAHGERYVKLLSGC